MEQFNVMGMSCAACSARVEKAVAAVDGVSSVSVSLLTNSMGVEGTANADDIINAVKKAGYGAELKNHSSEKTDKDSQLLDTETPKIRKRLIASAVFLLILMYFSMGHMMWGFPVPDFLENNHIAMGLLQLLLSGIVMVINQKFFVNGFKGIIHRSPNMDTLVALGAGAAFVYSTYALFAMTDAQLKGNMIAVSNYMHEFYFESSAMILTLITVGKMLEAYSKGKTTNALKGLISLKPKTAVIVKNGVESTVSVEQVQKEDIFAVRSGECIPVDGVVVEGNGAVNESALTGESVPVDKAEGDFVSAATIVQSGYIRCRATRVGEDTTLSQIIKTVSDAAATKAPIARVADKVSGIFVPAVITVALITAVVWLLIGNSFGTALQRAVSVLVISCPCALGLATPVAIMVGNGVGAKNGILFKTAVSLETVGKTDVVALDKTGTITQGEPEVTNVLANEISEQELMKYAAALECKSEHPLAGAIMNKITENNIIAYEVSDFSVHIGNGLSGIIDGEILAGGSQKYISSLIKIPESFLVKANSFANEGKTPLFFSKGEKLLGIIAVADVIKSDSAKAVNEMKNMGLKVVMLTGDNEKTANAIGRQAGVDKVIAGVMPDEKEKVIRELKKQGRVAMVGDGINDAPALTTADVGIAIGAGTDIAIDAADVVLMKSRLSDVAAAIRLGRATLRNIHENLFWAFIYNVIGIPLAAGVFISIFGWELNPMFAAAAMSLSSFCVVTNALRLNFIKIHTSKFDRKKHKIKNEEIIEMKINKTNKITVKINGMMCGHCEARVKQQLEKLPQVDEAFVSHKDNSAMLMLNSEILNDEIKNVVEDAGYEFVCVE